MIKVYSCRVLPALKINMKICELANVSVYNDPSVLGTFDLEPIGTFDMMF